jgi:hypothetical protein
VFSRGTSLKDAWRACGVELTNPRNAPWHAYRPDGTLVLTVWRDHPDAGRWIRWQRGNFSAQLRLRKPGEIPGESAQRIAKLEAHNAAIQEAAAAEATIIVLVLNWKRDAQGRFVAEQSGASVPVEAWRAQIGLIIDGVGYSHSIDAIDRVGPFPMEGAV